MPSRPGLCWDGPPYAGRREPVLAPRNPRGAGRAPVDDPLEALRWHWDEAYLVAHPEPDLWVAVRRDNHETLRAAVSLAASGWCAGHSTRRRT